MVSKDLTEHTLGFQKMYSKRFYTIELKFKWISTKFNIINNANYISFKEKCDFDIYAPRIPFQCIILFVYDNKVMIQR